MRISDLIIIYLAGGAPFAVYFYLQNRQRLFLRHLLVKTVLNYICWLPLSLQFTLKKLSVRETGRVSRRLKNPIRNETDANLQRIQKQIEQIAEKADARFNFYELRETINRYVGLSLSVGGEDSAISAEERQIFDIADSSNSEIGAICLQRRNRQRLLFHQTRSAADFVSAIQQLSESAGHAENLKSLSVELTRILEDSPTEKIISRKLQNERQPNVKNAEKILWNSPLKQPNARQVSVNLSSMSRTKLRLKD